MKGRFAVLVLLTIGLVPGTNAQTGGPSPDTRQLVAQLDVSPEKAGPGTTLRISGRIFERYGQASSLTRHRFLLLPRNPVAGASRIELEVRKTEPGVVFTRIPERSRVAGGSYHLVFLDPQGRTIGRSRAPLTILARSVEPDASGGRQAAAGNLQKQASGQQPPTQTRAQAQSKTQADDASRQITEEPGGVQAAGRQSDRASSRQQPNSGLAARPGQSLPAQSQAGQVGPQGQPAVPGRLPTRTALVLSGGGAKGAFQLGVLKYLYEERRFDPRIITGTSVGSLNAAKLAEGAGSFAQLERLWRGLEKNSDVYRESSALGSFRKFLEDEIEDAEETIGAMLVGTFVFPGLAHGWLSAGGADVLLGEQMSGLSAGVARKLDAIEGMNTQEPLFRLIDQYLNTRAIRDSGIKLSLATVARDSGQTCYINELGDLSGPDGRRLHRGEFNGGQVSVRDGVKASSAIPLVFQPYRIQGVYYWDGAIREDVPVRKALELGATDLVIVLCSPRAYRPAALAGVPAGLDVTPVKNLMKSLDIMADQVFQDDLNTVLGVLDLLHEMGWNGVRNAVSQVRSFPLPRDPVTGMVYTIPTYKVIEPPVVVGGITDFIPEIIAGNIELGQMTAREAYSESPNAHAFRRSVTSFLEQKRDHYKDLYERLQRVAEPPPGMEGHGPGRAKGLLGQTSKAYDAWHAFEAALRQYTGST